MKLLIATTNPGKTREIGSILKAHLPVGTPLELVGLGAFPDVSEAEEVGSTFEENAIIKACYYNEMSSIDTIADDSGLEVDALDGRPGVLSARYAGPTATDQDRIAKLLGELRGVPESRRTARFVCSAAFVGREGQKVVTAFAPGRILETPRGCSGFGYDPVFYCESLGKTFAELAEDEKSRVSHRGLAFAQLAQWLAVHSR